MTALDPRAELSAVRGPGAAGEQPGWRFTVGQYISLTKPRVIELLLITTAPVMFLAERGVPPLNLVVATLVGGSLCAGAANTFNCIHDRDIDAVMHRTSSRPLVTGTITPRQAVVFASVLTVLSILVLGIWVNWLSAALAFLALAFYVAVYTVALKRRTSQNIVWGGAAGCMPVLIGWSAVTGRVGWPAVVLFFVIFFWTPPHYWPLSMKFREDYESAGVPMLPVVARMTSVARHIVAYTWAMVVASLALVPVAQMGWIYTASAVAAGIVFLAEAHRLLRLAERGAGQAELRPMRLFHYSITYVTIVFIAVAVDPVVHFPLPWA